MTNKIFAIGIAIVAVMAFSFTAPNSNTGKVYVADINKSSVAWLGKKVTGSHDGMIKLSSGSLSFDGKTISDASFEIDMNSMTCKDITDETYNGKLIGHLKNDDFFSTDKFPKATFVLKSAKAKGINTFDITGDLTIKGISKSVTFPATVKMSGKSLTAQAKINVDRTLYDIKYGSGSFFDNLGDKAIDNIFTLDVNLVTEAK
ncbi:MAG: YceI family protein [Cytophagales bacterium]|nr:MAG: YceI family protein [Cytophagales bacterium]